MSKPLKITAEMDFAHGWMYGFLSIRITARAIQFTFRRPYWNDFLQMWTAGFDMSFQKPKMLWKHETNPQILQYMASMVGKRCIDCKELEIKGLQEGYDEQPREIGYCKARKAYVEINMVLEYHPCKDFVKDTELIHGKDKK